MTQRNNLRWWLWTCLSFAAIIVSWYFGFFHLLHANDATYLGLTIFTMYFLSSFYMMFKVWTDTYENGDFLWYISDAMEKLGMLGTVIGLIISFSVLFGNIDITQPEAAKTLISTVAYGVSTALYTTLAGIVCSFFLKTQISLLDMDHEKT